MNKLDLYCFSGTGNSLLAARWMAENSGLKSSITMISKETKFKPANKALIGLVYPTHAFTAPLAVMRFALSMPRSNGASVFCAATRGMCRPVIFVRGAHLSAGLIIAIILRLKGYRIAGLTGIDMPHNWTALLWGLNKRNVEKILARSKKKVSVFICTIVSGEKVIMTFSNCINIPLGIVLFPVSILYLAVGHFFLAKTYVPGAACTGCGVCAKTCPVNAITMKGGKKKIPYWTFSCESCMRCFNYCPNNAVECSTLLFAVYFAAAFFPNHTQIGRELFDNFRLSPGYYAAIAVYFLALFPLGALIYYFVHRFLVFKMVRRVITYTSLSHYLRKYHAPGISAQSITGKK